MTALLPRFVYPRCAGGFKFKPALRAFRDGTVAWPLFSKRAAPSNRTRPVLNHNARPDNRIARNPVTLSPKP